MIDQAASECLVKLRHHLRQLLDRLDEPLQFPPADTPGWNVGGGLLVLCLGGFKPGNLLPRLSDTAVVSAVVPYPAVPTIASASKSSARSIASLTLASAVAVAFGPILYQRWETWPNVYTITSIRSLFANEEAWTTGI